MRLRKGGKGCQNENDILLSLEAPPGRLGVISGLANYHIRITDGLLDIHGRIKSERTKDLDDDDMTDEDRKDDILGGNMHHILSNGYSLKSEIKSSDCGVPLPPSKPKIWSLADTAACKTPPPPPPSQGGQWLGSSNGFALPSSRYVPPIQKIKKLFIEMVHGSLQVQYRKWVSAQPLPARVSRSADGHPTSNPT